MAASHEASIGPSWPPTLPPTPKSAGPRSGLKNDPLTPGGKKLISGCWRTRST
jgi:hypothetical protein